MAKLKVTAPKGWDELTDEHLRSYCDLMTRLKHSTIEDILILLFFEWTHLHPVASNKRISIEVEYEGKRYILRKDDVSSHIDTLSYLRDLPEHPVRISKLQGHDACDATLDDATFEEYLCCDNLYQGYVATNDTELLQQMGEILYRCKCKFTDVERTSIFYWWIGLKTFLSSKYKNLFHPMSSETNLLGSSTADTVEQSMNAMIRALTKGDITKEKEIFAQPVHRAFTELEALAKEYDDMQRKLKS